MLQLQLAMATEDLLLAEEEEEEVDGEDCMTVKDVVPVRVNIWGDEEEDGLKAQVTASCVWPGHATVVFFSVFSLVGCTRVVRQEGSWAWLTMSVCV